MKSSLPKKVVLFCCIIIASFINVHAQVSQTVTIQPGYTNRTFYQMNTGTVSTVSNTDWDLGFQLRGRSGAITINSKNNVKLWNANKSVADWSTMTVSDTTGLLIPTNEFHNSEETWNIGAFNTTNDPANLFDLGWGLYDQSTHLITGDSVYFIGLANNTIFKKLKIEKLDGYTYDYTFRFADLDGSNEVVDTLLKSAFPSKFFAYFSIVNNVAIDREPVYNAWDLSFETYKSANVIPGSYYSVAGVLSNDSVFVAKAYPVDTAITNDGGFLYSNKMNAIGYNWKFYDQPNNLWVIADSTIYFVKDRTNITWKVVFTGFGGGANGNFYFTQSPVNTVGIIENSSIQTLGVFPNPAHGTTRVMIDSKNAGQTSVDIFDISGRISKHNIVELNGGIQAIDINLNGLSAGLYQIIFTQGSVLQVSRIVVE